jgi:hypothetical protein
MREEGWVTSVDWIDENTESAVDWIEPNGDGDESGIDLSNNEGNLVEDAGTWPTLALILFPDNFIGPEAVPKSLAKKPAWPSKLYKLGEQEGRSSGVKSESCAESGDMVENGV